MIIKSNIFFAVITLFAINVSAFTLSSVTSTNVQTSSAEITYKTSKRANTKVEYSLESSLLPSLTVIKYDAALVFSHRVALLGLQAGTKYYYRVSSSNGSIYRESSILSFETAGATIVTPPPFAISSIAVNNIQTNSAQVSWATNRMATGKVVFSTSLSLSAETVIVYDVNLLSNHSISLSGLQPNTIYYYRVSSADVNGVYAESVILSFKTTALSNPTPIISGILMTATDWQVAYDGYGFVNFDSVTGSVVFAPMAADSSGPQVDISNTHAVLLLANRYLSQGINNARITIDVATEVQLRSPSNAWEVFWLFFNYTYDSTGKKKTNYFTMKPNGIELGTAFDEVGQKFLFTSSAPVLTIGKRNVMVIEKVGKVVRAYVDGVLVMNYNNEGAINPLYDVAGTIGLYSEDARVRIYSVKVDPL